MENEQESVTTKVEDKEEIRFSANIRENLGSICKWGIFLSILGFVMIFFLLISSIYFIAASSVMYRYVDAGFKFSILSTTYLLLLAAIYFLPTYFLFKFSLRLKQGLVDKDQDKIEKGFKNLKLTFKYFGIISIATILISGIAIAAILYIYTSIIAVS